MNSKIFADKTLVFLKKYKNYEEKEEKILHYGLETIYIFITKTIFITILSLFLGITKEMFIFFLFYGILRLFADGMHLSKSLHCTIFSSIVLLGLPYISKYLIIPLNYRIIIIGIVTCLFVLYSPADTIKKPIIDPNRRFNKMIKSVITCIIYLILTIFITNNLIIN